MKSNGIDIYNVSVGAATVKINGIDIVKDSMDSGSPFEMSDVDITNIEWSCNGRMIRTVKPNAVMISVSVIPSSDADKALLQIWMKSFCNGGKVSGQDTPITASIGFGTLHINLTNGTCVSGPCGISADGAEKLRGNTYTFAFENI
ncbi:MAG: hypothetical protein J6Q22_10850 [Prevotella sp.]|nr:hypothetical protein [Prevotella sp.]